MDQQGTSRAANSGLPEVTHAGHGFSLTHVAAAPDVSYPGCHPGTQQNNLIVRITLDEFPGNVWNLFIPEGAYWLGLVDEEKGWNHFADTAAREWQADNDAIYFDGVPFRDNEERDVIRIAARLEVEGPEKISYAVTIGNLTDEPIIDCLFSVCFNHHNAPIVGEQRFIVVDGRPVGIHTFSKEKKFHRFRAKGRSVTEEELIFHRFCHLQVEAEEGIIITIGDELTAAHVCDGAGIVLSNDYWPCTDISSVVNRIDDEVTVLGHLLFLRGRHTPESALAEIKAVAGRNQ